VLRNSVNWLTIALQISAFTTLISSPGTFYSILSGCRYNRFPSPFIVPSDYSGILLNLTTLINSRDGKQRGVRRISSLTLVGVHAL
jgi:hypothetical protein